MPIMEVSSVGRIGIVSDIPPHELPPEAWSSGQNVKMADGAVQKSLGHTPALGTPSVAPSWVLPVETIDERYWIYMSLTQGFTTDGANQVDITRAGGYNATSQQGWNGGVFNGVPIINNGFNVPQEQNPVGATAQLGTLSNWPTNVFARVIRPFGSFLIALDVTKGGIRDPYKVKWPHPSGPGELPSSWDETDPTKLAGEAALGAKGGFVIDCAVLGGVNFIYKEDSIWTQQLVGGNFVFRFDERFGDDGILTANCVTPFLRKHLVVTRGDVKVHNGTNIESVIDRRRRESLFGTIDETNLQATFVFANYQKNEIWVCYPTSGNTVPNRAMVWNWKDASWGDRDLPGVGHIGRGVVSLAPTPVIDSVTSIIDETDSLIDTTLSSAVLEPLMAGTTDSKLYLADQTGQFDGANYEAFVERTGLAIVGRDRAGAWKVDPSVVKNVRAIYPRVNASEGARLEIQVGFQNTPKDPVKFSAPEVFDPEVDNKVTFLNVTGAYIAVKFRWLTNSTGVLSGYGIDWVPAGKL